MSDSGASLRHKIDSAAELQSVVRTMKAMAASSIVQYEKSVVALADYYRAVELGLGVCFRQAGPTASSTPRAERSRVKQIGAVVFGSDQGLVGQFNQVVVDYAVAQLKQFNNPRIRVVGERAHARLTDAGIQPAGQFTVPNSVQDIAPLVGQLLVTGESHHDQGDIDELHLFYNRPGSAAGYEPSTKRLLPLDDVWRRQLSVQVWPAQNLPEVLGNATATLGALIREYLFISLFRACAESLASENSSRLAAMQRAEKNIDELLAQLRDISHRVRQSGIDEELFDVISGFEALSGESGTPPESQARNYP
jgi:F-type H+-transporting ATPase subunit gamma